MRGKWQLLAGLAALVVALAAGQYAYTQYDSVVATAPVAVLAVPLQPYTLITPEMVTVRALPRPLLAEPIYVEPGHLAGKMTTQALYPGQVVYRHQAVPPAQFRLAAPELEVVSFAVQTPQIVGGGVRIGSRINLYRTVRKEHQSTAPSLRNAYAEVALAAENVAVIDVREASGGPATQDTSPPAASGNRSMQQQQQSQRVPIQIITLALPHAQAQAIVQLIAETAAGPVNFWITLAPVGETPTLAGEMISGTLPLPDAPITPSLTISTLSETRTVSLANTAVLTLTEQEQTP